MRLPPEKNHAKKAQQLLNFYAREWKFKIALIALLRIASFCMVAVQLYFLARILTLIVGQVNTAGLLSPVIWLFLFGSGRTLISYFSDVMAARLTELSVAEFRIRIIARLNAKSKHRKHAGITAGLALEMMSEADAIGLYYTRYLPQVIQCLAIPFITISYIAWINWLPAILILLTAPVIPVFMVIIGKGTETKSRAQWQTLSLLSNYFLDRLRGITTLSLFNRIDTEVSLIGRSSEIYAQRVMEVLKTAFLSSAVIDFFTAVAIAGVAIYTGLNLVGYIHLGPASAFTLQRSLVILLLVPEFFNALKKLGVIYHDRAQAIGAVMHFQAYDLLKENSSFPLPSGRDSRPGQDAEVTAPVIMFQKVTFGYVPGQKVLNDITFSILPGEKIWITGENGAGKTTVLSLLMRWLTPVAGSIQLNRQPLGEMREQDLYRLVSWVGPHAALFTGSIRSNILMGTEKSDAYLYENILPQVSLAERINNMPRGLDTLVAEDGKCLSGGERQKIALARALVKNAKILLLDEPLTHLDGTSAAELIGMLEQTTQSMTVIITGHGARYEAFKGYRKINL
ncbi:thiol reductant ABC exporter subunit CydD [Mucilaginibacter celer]|uniref:Thiol reductant ABC exporter subunit CydD n=1 Tax=Mucilaginibacter celer TaxID=2305508 RepID=A0A494VLI3_9SPHI|nr:thiol reductant ABC exporter subunit CydD [Mucilaginibacter celer]AYL95394.1 thiol reductant ABC exporter subunit CydD [Mucilaginibacter celer]